MMMYQRQAHLHYLTPFPAKFIPLSRPRTRKRKVEFAQTSRHPRVYPLVQSSIQPDIQRDYLNSLTETHIPDPDSPLYALAIFSVYLLKDIAHEYVYTPFQDLNPDS